MRFDSFQTPVKSLLKHALTDTQWARCLNIGITSSVRVAKALAIASDNWLIKYSMNIKNFMNWPTASLISVQNNV